MAAMTQEQELQMLATGESFSVNAKRKKGSITRTLKLRTMPATLSDEDIYAAVAKYGTDYTLSDKPDDERSKSVPGKGYYGAVAITLASQVLASAPPTTPAELDESADEIDALAEESRAEMQDERERVKAKRAAKRAAKPSGDTSLPAAPEPASAS